MSSYSKTTLLPGAALQMDENGRSWKHDQSMPFAVIACDDVYKPWMWRWNQVAFDRHPILEERIEAVQVRTRPLEPGTWVILLGPHGALRFPSLQGLAVALDDGMIKLDSLWNQKAVAAIYSYHADAPAPTESRDAILQHLAAA